MFRSTHSALFSRWLQLLATIAFLQAGLSQRVVAFEQVQRINFLNVQFGTDSFAATNHFGSAFNSAVQPTINNDITNDVGTGQLSLLFEMPGLTNLLGSNQPSMNLGTVNAQPVLTTNNPTAYSGLSDLDWWYAPDQDELNASGVPTNQLTASIVAGVMNSNPGRLSFTPSPLNGLGGRVDLSTAVIQATVGSSSAPLESTNGYPPGHLPVENISPQLASFASMTSGRLRGNISAASLAATPLPSMFAGTDGYTTNNTLLDVLVSGYVFEGILTEIEPTQPDQSDPDAPVLGAGPPYRFITTGKSVTAAGDKNGGGVSLSAAINAAAYSAYFTFTTDRVIAPAPALLAITNSATGVVVSWPSWLAGWTLQTNGSLSNPNWGDYPGVIVNNATTNPPSTGNLFFRLEY